jgi:hypothetical protein
VRVQVTKHGRRQRQGAGQRTSQQEKSEGNFQGPPAQCTRKSRLSLLRRGCVTHEHVHTSPAQKHEDPRRERACGQRHDEEREKRRGQQARGIEGEGLGAAAHATQTVVCCVFCVYVASCGGAGGSGASDSGRRIIYSFRALPGIYSLLRQSAERVDDALCMSKEEMMRSA